jgi:hypothetical protein
MGLQIYRDFSWMRVLSLPTLEWAKPFFSLTGLPDSLLKERDKWNSIYVVLKQAHQDMRKQTQWSKDLDEISTQEAEITRQAVSAALHELAEKTSTDTAYEWEKWVRFHFFNLEANSALFEWERVLRYLYIPENSRKGRRKLPIPDILKLFLAEIYELVNLERRNHLREQVEKAAPKVPVEEWEKVYPSMKDKETQSCYEATLIKIAIDQSLTFQALNLFASQLSVAELQGVVTWTKAQIKAMDSRHGEERTHKLRGIKYIRTALPDLEDSLLNEPGIKVSANYFLR